MKKKLLLADDSITIQKVIAITFSSDDYALTVVDNGDVALEKARGDKPDLVLADVFMPGKNGYELCAAIKQDPQLSDVPVLLLTGTFEPFDEAKARAVGAEKWIAKPFESQALIDCVEGLLSGGGKAAAPAAAPRPAAPAPVAPAAPARPQAPVTAAAPPAPAPAPAAAPRPTPAAPSAVVPPPPAAPAAADDLWGDTASLKDDFAEFGGATGDADLLATTNGGDDLWGAVSLDELEASGAETMPALEEDVWGSIEEELPQGGTPAAVAGDQDLWGGFESDAPAGAVATESTSAWDADDGALVMEEVEILEEEDLSLEIAPPSPAGAYAGAPMELELEGVDSGDSGLTIDWDEPASAVAAPALKTAAPPLPALEEEFAPPAQTAVTRAPQPQPRPAAPVEAQVATLSEADLERIVEKVAGAVIERLAGTVLEKVAWDVVPDLAESMIKNEIQKIKEAV